MNDESGEPQSLWSGTLTGSLNAWVVSITPFDASGALDEPGLRQHLRRLRDAKIGVYVGSSNAGEGFTLNDAERRRLFEIAVEELKGKVPVRAGGCEPQSIASAIDYVQAAEACGLDAAHVFQIDPGHAGPPSPAEIESYYSHVVASTSIPIVLSNYPGMGYAVPVGVLARMLERFPQVIAVRDAGNDAAYLREIAAICKGRADLYTTGVKNVVNALAHGSRGFLCGEANVAPALAVVLLEAFMAGNFESAMLAYGHLYRLHQLIGRFGGAAGRGMKPLLARLGLPAGTLRPPRIAISPAELAQMFSAYETLQLPGSPSVL